MEGCVSKQSALSLYAVEIINPLNMYILSAILDFGLGCVRKESAASCKAGTIRCWYKHTGL